VRGARLVRRAPGFAAVTAGTLALGIGAATALFSVVDAVLLRPLPFHDQRRLAILWQRDVRRGVPFLEVSYPDWRDWRDESRSFVSMAVMPSVSSGFTVTGRGEPLRLEGRLVGEGFFDVLGAGAARGRTFRRDEHRGGAGRVVVLSDGLWRRAFGGDPSIIGGGLTIDETAFTVVGVMPPTFDYPDGAELWTPLEPAVPRLLSERGTRALVAIGRLAPGVSFEAARAEMNGIVRRLEQTASGTAQEEAVITPLPDALVGTTRPALMILVGAVAVLLLVACANVASLLLSRATTRRREAATRLALGASRGRMVSQLLAETLPLAVLGGAGGLACAWWALGLVRTLDPGDVPRLAYVAVDGRALAVALAATAGTAILCGLAPAWQSSGPDLVADLREGGRGATEGLRPGGARGLLVVGEVAMALVLVAAAGLMGRSLTAVSTIDLGFSSDHLLTFEVPLTESKYPETADATRFFETLVERLEALPEVERAAAVLLRPLWGPVGLDWPYLREGQTEADSRRNPLVNLEAVTPGYFETLGIPLVEGRLFTAADDELAPGVVVVSESMARYTWPGQSPLGRRLKMPLPGSRLDREWVTVVGVVGDARYRAIESARHDVYLASGQAPFRQRHVVVRTAGDPLGVARAAVGVVRAIDPDQPVVDVSSMDQIVARALGGRLFQTGVFAAFAALALVIASVGMFGVMAYWVTESTREIGVRVALGATTGDVMGLVVGRGLRLVVVGVGVGLAAAMASTRLLTALLFEVTPTDPLTFASTAALIGLVALGACLAPAWWAARVDPIVALRRD